MAKLRPWCGQPSDRGRLKNRTGQHQLSCSRCDYTRMRGCSNCQSVPLHLLVVWSIIAFVEMILPYLHHNKWSENSDERQHRRGASPPKKTVPSFGGIRDPPNTWCLGTSRHSHLPMHCGLSRCLVLDRRTARNCAVVSTCRRPTSLIHPLSF